MLLCPHSTERQFPCLLYTSRETLLAAQERPEDYKDLVVRVAGYSAQFTVLAKEVQDDIISRTEQTL